MNIITAAQSLAWNPLLLAGFLGVGLYFTVRSKFFQFTHPRTIFKSTFGKMKSNDDTTGISPLSSLTCALAACMGTGNIIGVAGALTLGGPGAVFWMLVSALLGMMTCCAENILGIKYRIKNQKGEWLGGSMLYIERAFRSKIPATVFAVLCVAASLGMGNMTQANAISTSVSSQCGVHPLSIGIVVAALGGVVVFGGVKRIAAFTEKLIPIASAVFILASLAVIFICRKNAAQAISSIFTCAFSAKSAVGGAVGYSVKTAIRYGVSRGVFSNEAGLGSSPIVHAAAAVDKPETQGMWGIVEVFIDTVLMCTLTAVMLISSGAYTAGTDISPVEMNVNAFSKIIGNASGGFVAASLCVFAFATIVGWSYYGERAAEYAFGSRSKWAFRCVYLACSVIGAAVKLETVWALADIFNALMAVPNLAALIVLRREAVCKEE